MCAMTRGPLVLLVEDEPVIADLVRSALEREGYAVLLAGDGPGALAAVARHRPALILLDVGLPGLDGIEVCRRLRAAQDWTPVLFVTARDEEADRVLGLELGADDYVTKPFSPRELMARVRAVLRRGRGSEWAGDRAGDRAEQVTLGRLTLDLSTRRVRVAPGPGDVELTTTEFDLLAHLMRRPDRVFTREELLADVWGYPAGTATRTVDVHIAQLRAKLGQDLTVRSVRGVGYAVQG